MIDEMVYFVSVINQYPGAAYLQEKTSCINARLLISAFSIDFNCIVNLTINSVLECELSGRIINYVV